MKNTTLDVLKGLAIVLVIYGHLIQRAAIVSGQDFFAHPIFKIIYTFHMPIFFFISGYLVAVSLSRRTVADVFKIRFWGLLIPYFTWGTLGVVAVLVLNLSSGVPSVMVVMKEWIYQLLMDPQVWFLWTLFFCSGILLLTVTLQRYCGIVIFAIIYALMLGLPLKEWGAQYYIVWFYPFYAAGYLINRYGASWIQKVNRPKIFVWSAILFFLLVSFWSINDYVYIHKMSFVADNFFVNGVQFGYRYFVSFLGIAVVFFAAKYFIKDSAARFWSFIGVYSLDIYLLQRYLVEGIFARLWPRTGMVFDVYSPLFLFVLAPLITAAAVSLCIVISQRLLRPRRLMNTLFLGQRS